MSKGKCKATISVTFTIEFEDDGDLALEDQAYDEAISRFDQNDVWYIEVCQVGPCSEDEKLELPV